MSIRTKGGKGAQNPGVRVQGSRIYDSITGTTCHQCRQKTVELKAKCTDCPLHWCSRCLLNRYGEEVEKVKDMTKWPCPRCRKVCNCSNCRRRQGLEATGILADVCKAAGIDSVSDLLSKNPHAKRPDVPPAAGSAKCQDAKPTKATRPSTTEPNEQAGVPDAELGPRPAPFPAGRPLQLRSRAQKRQRDTCEWVEIPADCSPGDLIEVLEFLEVFGRVASCRVDDPALLAAELLQPQSARGSLCTDRCSPVGRAHRALLDLVRRDAGLPGTVGTPGWQDTMCDYLKKDRERAAQELGIAAEGSPAAGDSGGGGADDMLAQFPDGGYWSLPPGARLRMFRELCHDALCTTSVRRDIDDVIEGTATALKERQRETAAAQKEARQAWQAERDRQVALLLAGGGGRAMTMEEQKALVNNAIARTGGGAVDSTPVDLRAVRHPAVRTLPLGADRDGRTFWQLKCRAVFTGDAGAILASRPWHSTDVDQWTVQPDVKLVAEALDARGRSEGPLRELLCRLAKGGQEGAPGNGKAEVCEANEPLRKYQRTSTRHVATAKLASHSYFASPCSTSRSARGSQVVTHVKTGTLSDMALALNFSHDGLPRNVQPRTEPGSLVGLTSDIRSPDNHKGGVQPKAPQALIMGSQGKESLAKLAQGACPDKFCS